MIDRNEIEQRFVEWIYVEKQQEYQWIRRLPRVLRQMIINSMIQKYVDSVKQ